MTAFQLREVLATANNRQHDQAARSAWKGTSAYYRAWLWVTANAYGWEHIPHRGPFEPWELEGITHTIRQIQDVIPLQDPA